MSVQDGALAMATAELAAKVVVDVLTDDIPAVIDELVSAGTITALEGQAWRTRCAKIAETQRADLWQLHLDMITRLTALGVDAGPAQSANAATELANRAGTVHPDSGGR